MTTDELTVLLFCDVHIDKGELYSVCVLFVDVEPYRLRKWPTPSNQRGIHGCIPLLIMNSWYKMIDDIRSCLVILELCTIIIIPLFLLWWWLLVIMCACMFDTMGMCMYRLEGGVSAVTQFLACTQAVHVWWISLSCGVLWCVFKSRLISILCVLLMLFLQIANHNQSPHPLLHPPAPTPPHNDLVSKACTVTYCTRVFHNVQMCVHYVITCVHELCIEECGHWTVVLYTPAYILQ